MFGLFHSATSQILEQDQRSWFLVSFISLKGITHGFEWLPACLIMTCLLGGAGAP